MQIVDQAGRPGNIPGGLLEASRSGLDAALLNPVTGLPEEARIVVNILLDHCRDALADAEEADAVAELLTARPPTSPKVTSVYPGGQRANYREPI